MSSISPNSPSSTGGDSPPVIIRSLPSVSSTASSIHTPPTLSASPPVSSVTGVDLASRLSLQSSLEDVKKVQKIALESGVSDQYDASLVNRALSYYKSEGVTQANTLRRALETALIDKSKISELDSIIKSDDNELIEKEVVRSADPLVFAYNQAQSRRNEVLQALHDKSKITEYDEKLSKILYQQNVSFANEAHLHMYSAGLIVSENTRKTS